MARSRNIKASFFNNDELAEVHSLGRLMFIGMWTIADYRGNFEWREKKVKQQVLPYDDCDIKKLAINLDKFGFIRFYSDGDKMYVNIVNFTKHQNPHKNEKIKGSDIPDYSESMRQVVDFKELTINRDLIGKNQDEYGVNPADSCFLIPDPCSLIPDPCSLIPDPCSLIPEEKPKGKKQLSPAKAGGVVNTIFEHWKTAMGKNESAIFNAKRKAAVNARLKEGYTQDDIISAIDGCAKTPHNNGFNESGKRFDDLELICRNGANVERFAANSKAQPNNAYSERTQSNIDMLSNLELK